MLTLIRLPTPLDPKSLENGVRENNSTSSPPGESKYANSKYPQKRRQFLQENLRVSNLTLSTLFPNTFRHSSQEASAISDGTSVKMDIEPQSDLSALLPNRSPTFMESYSQSGTSSSSHPPIRSDHASNQSIIY